MGGDILLVDDNVDNLKTLESFFVREGYSVRCATNGKTALMIAQNLKPGIVLLDIQMPGMNGFDVCTEFKKNNLLKDVPILFISAETSISEKIKAFEYGAVDYITKPFQFEETLARVNTHLNILNLKNALEKSNINLQNKIVELNNTQDMLIQSAKLASIGTLVAGVAHEINNPINYIMTGIPALELVLKKIKKIYSCCTEVSECKIESDVGDINELLQITDEILRNIKTGALKTADIVKSLQEFSRTDNAISQNVNINECLDIALMILHNQYKLNIVIEKKYGNIRPISVFKGKIEQVFLNIIKNSIDAVTSKGIEGKIIITTGLLQKEEKEFISIEIADNGGGIDEQSIDKIFDPFYTTKEVGKGTGLGLSITYSIIQNHNGVITVENVDDGLSVVVLLPVN